MRSAALAMAAVLVVGLGVLLWRSLAGKEIDAVRPGVLASAPVATLEPGQQLCQRPLDIDRPVRRIGLAIFNGPRPGPPMRVRIRDVESGAPLAEYAIPRGWSLAPNAYLGQTLPRPLPADRAIEVCARNEGAHSLELYGKEAINYSNLYEGNENVGGDWAIFFPLLPDERRSYLEMIPDLLRRASVVRPGIVGPLTYAILGVLLLVGAPLLLYRAVVRASDD